MTTNAGTQTVSIMYHSVANAATWNKRFVDIHSTGIYTGGWLSIVNGTTAQISVLACEITDGTYQVRVSTSTTVNITISSVTPYIVLRWVYGGTTSDYMEILAVSSPAANDLVVGLCTFAGGGGLNGFNYSERSNPSTKELFLKVEPTGETELRVRIRGGYYQTPTASVKIPDQKSDAITPPLADSRVYLIYVDTDGTVRVDSTGTPAAVPVAPSYANKMVIAEVTLASTATNITANDITDVRPFITPIVPGVDGISITTSALGKLKQVDPVYLVARTIGAQLSNLAIWTLCSSILDPKVYSGLTMTAGVLTLPAGRLYKISYSVVFGAQGSLPTSPEYQARLRVLTGDTSWWLDDNEYNVSLQKAKVSSYQALQPATLSGTFLILPSSTTTIQLEVKTRSSTNEYGEVLYATLSAWAD